MLSLNPLYSVFRTPELPKATPLTSERISFSEKFLNIAHSLFCFSNSTPFQTRFENLGDKLISFFSQKTKQMAFIGKVATGVLSARIFAESPGKFLTSDLDNLASQRVITLLFLTIIAGVSLALSGSKPSINNSQSKLQKLRNKLTFYSCNIGKGLSFFGGIGMLGMSMLILKESVTDSLAPAPPTPLFSILAENSKTVVACAILFMMIKNLAIASGARASRSSLQQPVTCEIMSPPEGTSCSICLESSSSAEEAGWVGHRAPTRAGDASAVVNHLFHRACLDPWIARQGHCPACRINLVRTY